jgi:hypothetical protein
MESHDEGGVGSSRCAPWSVLDPGTLYALRSFFQYDLEWSSGLTWHVADMHSKWNIISEHVTESCVPLAAACSVMQ